MIPSLTLFDLLSIVLTAKASSPQSRPVSSHLRSHHPSDLRNHNRVRGLKEATIQTPLITNMMSFVFNAAKLSRLISSVSFLVACRSLPSSSLAYCINFVLCGHCRMDVKKAVRGLLLVFCNAQDRLRDVGQIRGAKRDIAAVV